MNLSAVMRPVDAGDDNTACADFDQLIGGLGFAPVQVGGLREEGKADRLLPMDTEVECDR